ncbi:hypothetical protein EVD32_04060 [Bacteroidales bacterium SW299]|nr:hypothetical protein [Bacteroidales bacterium SW299]
MMRKIAGYLTKNRSGKDQKIAQSTHENEYIKPRKTFWRNSKQFLNFALPRFGNCFRGCFSEAVLISFDKFVKHDLDECNLYHSFCGFSKEFIIDGQPSEVFQP